MIRVFTRQMQKLHREEGQALVFVAMVGLVVFLFIAMTMNLAEVINIKIKSQNVADAAALSAAAWQSRALNTVAGMNDFLLNYWASFLPELALAVGSLWTVGALCCNWTCMSNPVCLAALLLYSGMVFTFLTHLQSAMQAGMLQNDVVNTFNEDLLLQDLPRITALNYAFKENLQNLRTGVYFYTHENEGNLWIRTGGVPGSTRYVLERAGCCETIIALYYKLCRGGALPTCQPDWRVGWRNFVTSGFDGLGLDGLYQAPGPGSAGACYQSNVNTCRHPLFMDFLNPFVLHTYHEVNWTPQDFEELLPVTVGVYREPKPPVIHLWGSGLLRREMNCGVPPEGKENWFPCTDQGHFAFASAHPYSQAVADFYQSFVDAGISTPYPIPLAFAEMDWQGRLFAVEPLQEQGGQSPECGRQAYDDILVQIGEDLGGGTEAFLRTNTLEDPAHPGQTFFHY